MILKQLAACHSPHSLLDQGEEIVDCSHLRGQEHRKIEILAEHLTCCQLNRLRTGFTHSWLHFYVVMWPVSLSQIFSEVLRSDSKISIFFFL